MFGKELPNITILTTGGTIAGAGDSAVEAGYTSGSLTGDQLITAVPEILNLANIKVEEISDIGSQDMNNEVWLKLSKRINELLSSNECDGIVVTHGTDTMEETAYFLNLTTHSSKPVILVGSMRPSTAISADGPINLFNAVSVAVSKDSSEKGVLVVMNDKIFNARDISKTNTTNVDTFKNPNGGPIGLANYGDVEFYTSTLKKHTIDTPFNIDNLDYLPRVEIIYGYANNSRLFTDAAITAKVDGIIYAGVGNGNIYYETMEGLKEAVKNRITVAISSRTGSGKVDNGETNFSELDMVTSDNLNPQKSRVLLMLALTLTKKPDEIQDYFNEY